MKKKGLFLLLPIYLISFVYLPSLSAFGAPQGYTNAPQGYTNAPQGYTNAPQGYIYPGCFNSVDEYDARFNVNGFLPHSFVGWEFIAPDGSRTMHGYFATNATGGFEEEAEVESLMEGEHTLFLFDDSEHDYNVDQYGKLLKYTIEVPCN